MINYYLFSRFRGLFDVGIVSSECHEQHGQERESVEESEHNGEEEDPEHGDEAVRVGEGEQEQREAGGGAAIEDGRPDVRDGLGGAVGARLGI